MSKKTGNVKHEEPEKKKEPEHFEPGDIVRMSQETLRDPELSKMSPRVILTIGLPNEFQVVKVFELESVVCLTLDPCCYRRVDRNGKRQCTGHPAVLFERVAHEHIRQPGDKIASITVPFLGELMGYEYQPDGHGNSKAIFRVGGKEMKAEGGLAELLNKVIQNHGII
jgi:hypothetical protein